MPSQLAIAFETVVSRETPELNRIPDADTGLKPGPRAWSKKEELGHLIDSAANNHQRFVRAAINGAFSGPGYEQDEWVERHGYNQMVWLDLVEFWRRYNLMLAVVVSRIPEELLQASCVVGSGAPVTLRFLIEDYLVHMQHHLDHVIGREKVTPYPQAAKA
jgi:hypothetical protein